MTKLNTVSHPELTFRGNIGTGRHGWLRLTPAYSMKLVRERVSKLPSNSNIYDPFSGTGTTPLASAEYGHTGFASDLNPFLVWLGNAKLFNYRPAQLADLQASLGEIVATAQHSLGGDHWQPKLFKIEKWWSFSSLNALKAIRSSLESFELEESGKNLLYLAFCQVLISCSSAAFNHQSMSFKPQTGDTDIWNKGEALAVIEDFRVRVGLIIAEAAIDLEGEGKVVFSDARNLTHLGRNSFEAVITSPPYANRMSYIRELRPYMYWLGYLEEASDAGDLDWKAIGGTWGTATSKLASWEQALPETAVFRQIRRVCDTISNSGDKNSLLMSRYVMKYFYDTWLHLNSVMPLVADSGYFHYVVGNSTFYGNLVPTEKWLAMMFSELGAKQVRIETLRKRNSNKALYEFDVSAVK